MVMDRAVPSGALGGLLLAAQPWGEAWPHRVSEALGSPVAVTLTVSGLLWGPLFARPGMWPGWGGHGPLGPSCGLTALAEAFHRGLGWSLTIEALPGG